MNFIDRLNEEVDEQESPNMSEIMNVLNSIKTQQNDIEVSLINLRKYHDSLIESCGKMYETLRGKLSAKQIKEIIETFLGCVAH